MLIISFEQQGLAVNDNIYGINQNSYIGTSYLNVIKNFNFSYLVLLIFKSVKIQKFLKFFRMSQTRKPQFIILGSKSRERSPRVGSVLSQNYQSSTYHPQTLDHSSGPKIINQIQKKSLNYANQSYIQSKSIIYEKSIQSSMNLSRLPVIMQKKKTSPQFSENKQKSPSIYVISRPEYICQYSNNSQNRPLSPNSYILQNRQLSPNPHKVQNRPLSPNPHIVQNQKSVQLLEQIDQNVLKSHYPNKTKEQNTEIQTLRKLKVLENRISQLHRQKQIQSIKMQNQNQNLLAQNIRLSQLCNLNRPNIQQTNLINLLQNKVNELQSQIQRHKANNIRKSQSNKLNQIGKSSSSIHHNLVDNQFNAQLQGMNIQLLQDKIKSLTQQLQSQRNENKLKILQMNGEHKNLSAKLKETEQILNNKNQAYVNLEKQFNQVKLNFKEAEKQIQKNNKQIISQYQKIINTLKNQIRDQQNQISALKQPVNSIQQEKQIESNLLKINEVIQRITNLQEQNQRLKEENLKIKEEKQNMLSEKNELILEKEKSSDQIHFLMDNIEEKANKIEHLKSQRQTLIKNLEEYGKELKQFQLLSKSGFGLKSQSCLQNQEQKQQSQSTRKYKDLIKTVMKLNTHLNSKK